MQFPLRLGSRGSPLALTQANMVAGALRAAHGWGPEAIRIVPIKTSGDRIQDRPLAEVGGKALWTKELDRALFEEEIDFAVHSMKDVETIRPAEIVIAAMLPRADVRDRLIGAESLDALPAGARVGTSSPRRSAQILRARPDVSIVLFRGNVDTRLRRLAGGEAEATLLAAAGLDRLGRSDIGHAVPVETMLPAPAQGAVGIETLAAREDVRAALAAIDDACTSACVRAERALLAALGADCRAPVAALALREGDMIRLRAEILREDGRSFEAGEARFAVDALEAAAELARDLLARAEPDLRAHFRR
ncbi:hydroxymethylbilane synthase [Sphingomonas oleivorans]|uniref:Porphobilinogen deaminase n=1 Tax=Sphingomonas oleivorans TaxID=1735121 RepID=A0A2T5G2M0_9SPHN|nr:hydroxymethylbilane synthase [Sphingomonas oleivorans]PTQ13394.1 hydroxymethylbilane synthase [Sphingomonas oleivorans]